MSKKTSDLPYRLGVGIMLVNSQGLVFIAQRIDRTSEAWQMPQGGMDANELPRETAMRELREEIGTDKAEILFESPDWYYYDLPDALIPIIWNGQFRGQQQKWFVMRFTGTDADINIQTSEPEFCEWKWVKAAMLPDVIVPFKRDLYNKLLHDFKKWVAF